MIGSFVVVFREILEAALVVGVVAASVKGLRHRGRWLGLGAGIGVMGAALVAAGISEISNFAGGTGQEIFAAGVLFAAGLMLAWHNVWMARHGRELSARLRTLGAGVLAGHESLTILVGVTALAIMREGSEIALFLYGIAASGVDGAQLLGGSVLGLAAGVGAGFALFAGLSRIPVQRLFRISALIILFIAAGMIARGAQFLVQADLLPPLVARAWDTSAVLDGNGILGRSLSALVGYTPAPSLTQVLVWLASFAAIGGAMLAQGRGLRLLRRGAVPAACFTLCLSAGVLRPGQAQAADYNVYSPRVVPGESEVELRTFNSRGTDEQTGAERGLQLAVGRAFTSRWATELYVEAEQEFGETLKFEALEWENRFQLTPEGKYWVDVGLLNETEIPRFDHDPYRISFGPTLGKDFGRWSALVNLLAVRQLGTNAKPGVALEYRAQVQYRWRREFSPFIEAYGESAELSGAARRQIGPGATGQIRLAAGRSLRYAAAALIGTDRGAADTTLVLRLEYEFH